MNEGAENVRCVEKESQTWKFCEADFSQRHELILHRHSFHTELTTVRPHLTATHHTRTSQELFHSNRNKFTQQFAVTCSLIKLSDINEEVYNHYKCDVAGDGN